MTLKCMFTAGANINYNTALWEYSLAMCRKSLEKPFDLFHLWGTQNLRTFIATLFLV